MSQHPISTIAGVVAAGLIVASDGVIAIIKSPQDATLLAAIASAVVGPVLVQRLKRDGDRRAETLNRIESKLDKVDDRAHVLAERLARVEGALFPQGNTHQGDNQ